VEGYPIPIYSTQERTGLALSMPNLCTRNAKKFSKQVTFTDHLIQNLYSNLLKQAIICQVLISKLLDLTQQTTYKLARDLCAGEPTYKDFSSWQTVKKDVF
jgi:hypothetical protein